MPADKKNVFVLDDGTKAVTLTNPYGKVIATLHIRTGDYSIIDRYNALEKEFPKITEPLTSINLNADGTSTFEDDWTKLKQVEATLISRLNDLFDTDEIGEIFKTRNPFSSVGGHFFAENVMEVLGQIIAQSIEEGAKAAEKRTAKYLKDIPESANAGTTANKP